uniref:TlpA family protein disulfide reductase n=2 Tax=Meiothermus ruber TaxID=277 RepID=A0A7C3HJ04_MEIRU
MRRWIWLMLLLVGGLGVFLLQPRAKSTTEVLPSITLQRLEGAAINLTDFKGKPILLNAWATWCEPCRREMPLLLKAARTNPDVQFIFVNISDGPEAVKAFEKELGLKIPNVVLDPEARLSDPLRIQGLPVTLFYDAEGRLINRRIGEIRAEELPGLLEAF